ncbi:hypothetical protein DUNSADRAFT_18306 [Dunaliella salina]|uniref:Encoded protein n=1 Tax=Dunaliella salina TaxID=3046 RepID=A0ABQ7GZ56_DUNSA|nr:hypothetical protein DUNSADRAFT_18306 [Dunaliella salina]|eukprot:KAF5839891.1 hypothetical protein DUNSADRAFT_18306 [Dunaliella salina]
MEPAGSVPSPPVSSKEQLPGAELMAQGETLENRANDDKIGSFDAEAHFNPMPRTISGALIYAVPPGHGHAGYAPFGHAVPRSTSPDSGDQDARVYGETVQRDLQQGGTARAQSPGGTLRLVEPQKSELEQQDTGKGQQVFVPQGY